MLHARVTMHLVLHWFYASSSPPQPPCTKCLRHMYVIQVTPYLESSSSTATSSLYSYASGIMSTSANIIPIPQELLEHPAIEHHPGVKKLHEVHGGIPPDADEGVVEGVLQFANAIANHAVEPGTKSRRTDPSPRRTARVWRSQVLGHRDPSESPERAAQLGASSNDASPGPSHSPVRARYRSRSRQPTTTTVKEEEDDGVKSVRFPGKRDEQNANDGTITALEHRVSVMIQQQHEFHERLLQRFTVVEKRVEGAEARYSFSLVALTEGTRTRSTNTSAEHSSPFRTVKTPFRQT